jgi:hypothetical protein
MEVLRVSVSAEDKPIADIKILGLAAGVIVMKSKTSIASTLHDLCIFDPTAKATYPRVRLAVFISYRLMRAFSLDLCL